ncbi:unnamed protein product [Mytilus coruscus]|uniref:Uncharacterized protein n=1 Tax=Mytilus coruscus TaxID=42192 RepID=A0A6J8A193_MYTCO|nr:unnamed protein product [Mytilus coruscus]
MIPYHLADLQTFPQSVLDHFEAGCFSVSITGKNYYCVALDEAHEMEINLKTKQAINSFSPTSLATLTHYLPYRAETLHNIKNQLCIEKSDSQYRETSKPIIETEELTIRQYLSELNTISLFQENSECPLVHIFKKTVATTDQSNCMLNYREYGNTDMQKYITCFLIKSTILSAKQMHGRKRMNLKTFAPMKINCIFEAHSETCEDLDQFISLPRAISDASGQPLKGTKSNALKVIKLTYEAAFLSSLPVIDDSVQSNVILEGMFLINTIPLSSHRTISDYAEFLFNRWIVKSHIQFKAQEIHVVFDHPNRNGTSPKDIERSRRIHDFVSEKTYKTVSSHVLLPNNWQNFLNVRDHKRKLVNYLSYQVITLSLQRFQNHECVVITAGGFDDVNVDKALSSLGGVDGSIVECCHLNSNHEEGETRVWLHAIQSKAQRIIIYSPDTDTFFVGLPFIDSVGDKTIYLQLKDSCFDHQFVDMRMFAWQMSNDMCLKGLSASVDCLQMVYISSGCDFVFFFHGYGKKTFFDIFRQNADFISSDLSICDEDNMQGLCAFFRLILCVYFSKHRTAFQPASSVKEMYDKTICESALDKHVALIKDFRERMWERVWSEVKMIPNAEALKLHWLKCCLVMQYWKQGNTNFMSLPEINSCKCVNCVNLPTNLNQAVDDPDSDLEDSEQEEDISCESDSETDINEFAADTSGNTSTAYINYWDTFENYIFALPTD